MTNPYYNPTGAPAQGSAVTSAVVRTEFAAIQAGFDKMPVLTGNAYEILRVKGDESGFEASGLVVDASGNLGIGVATPSALLHVYSATVANILIQGDATSQATIHRNSTDAFGPSVVYRKARGTSAAPVAVASGDVLGSLVFNAFAGTNARAIAGLTAKVDTYTSDTAVGAYLQFTTSPNSAAAAVENMRIWQDGTVTLGGLSTAPALKVNAYTAGNWVTISSGTNPTIGTSAGSLGISSPISQVTSSGASIVLFQSTAASVENTVQISATQATSGASLKISNSGNNVQVALRLTGTGHLDIYTNQTADAIPTSGNIGFRVANAVGSRYVTVTPDNTNPQIGVTGGSLAVSCPMVVSPGAGNTFSVNNGYVDFGGRLDILTGQALPAGGNTSVLIQATASNIGIYFGSGAPTVAASCIGSLYLRSDGGASTRLYSANSTAGGAGSWSAITSA